MLASRSVKFEIGSLKIKYRTFNVYIITFKGKDKETLIDQHNFIFLSIYLQSKFAHVQNICQKVPWDIIKVIALQESSSTQAHAGGWGCAAETSENALNA